MRKEDREVVADWMMVAGGVVLFLSLFLTWSHQVSPVMRTVFGQFGPLRGVPDKPTAWQVYSSADVVLALLAIGIVGVALHGSRAARLVATVSSILGLMFTIHALSAPPTNGAAHIFNPQNNVPQYLPLSPGAGIGETLAIIALLICLGGLALSFTAD
jgi:hypothetical protein